LDEGDIVSAYSLGEALIDEATGINLGSEQEFQGDLKVTQVNAKFSKAKLISGTAPSKGSIIIIKTKASENTSSNGNAANAKRGRKI
jgi:hypothetical protein